MGNTPGGPAGSTTTAADLPSYIIADLPDYSAPNTLGGMLFILFTTHFVVTSAIQLYIPSSLK
jgi:hypothetical protein